MLVTGRGRTGLTVGTIGLIAALAGCAGGTITASPLAQSADAVCHSLAEVPAVTGDGSVKTVESKLSTVLDVDTWLQSRARQGGPERTLASYGDLKKAGEPSDPMYDCVYQGKPRPIPLPPSSDAPAVADGISVIADSSGEFQIDGLGPLNNIRKEVAGLTTK